MTIQIEIPDKALATPQYSRQDLLTDLAIMLYQRQVYSLAKAARFAQMNRLEFQQVLAERGVYIHYDLEIDLETLKHL
jgi:predicted HTH domain antitoxin